jgi:hypothetical protein
MTSMKQRPGRHRCSQSHLMFAPLAWLKLQFYCHVGEAEIGGFGITAKGDLLFVKDFVTVRQQASMMTVAMEDEAVADFSDRCVDAGADGSAKETGSTLRRSPIRGADSADNAAARHQADGKKMLGPRPGRHLPCVPV